MSDLSTKPHRRYNPLLDNWIIVSPHRLQRPWQGKVEKNIEKPVPSHDPGNPLCPGSQRPNGDKNPDYESTFVFPNDFPALKDVTISDEVTANNLNPLFRTSPAAGSCQVMCFHPRSDLQLAIMTEKSIIDVIREWAEQTRALAQKWAWVQVFENKGAIQGCSNPHPHCQIWCCGFLPKDPETKNRTQLEYKTKYGSLMLLDYAQRDCKARSIMLLYYAEQELANKERVVAQNEDWVVVVPFWAMWPYETLLLPAKRQILRFYDLSDQEQTSLASLMKQLLVKYDNLFQCSFPYSMGWQGAPSGKFLQEDMSHWQLHASWFPPLLRSATVKKFIAGFELLCEPQRDLTPEKAAEQLRNLPDVHYTENGHEK